MTKRSKLTAIVCVLLSAWLVLFAPNAAAVADAAGFATTINSAMIDSTATNVNVVTSTATLPASDDGLFYLFANNVYEGNALNTPLTSAGMAANVTFTVPLNKNTAESVLFKKFIVAVKQGGAFKQVSEAHYITNPECGATLAGARRSGAKKGIILDAVKIHDNSQRHDLGITQGAYNIFLDDIVNTKGSNTIAYQFNGKTYYFNAGKLAQYDDAYSTFYRDGIDMTAVILTRNKAGSEYLWHPLARDGGCPAGCPYGMLNCAEQQGADTIAAALSFLAERYGDGANGYGQIDNWVIGNEINARGQWNYLQKTDVATYSKIYADGFRIAYNAIKSQNANARVAMNIDQTWNRKDIASYPTFYNGKDVLDNFAASITLEGNIDWALSQHPYNVPLNRSAFWAPLGAYKGLVTHKVTSYYLTMENIEVLTDYMCGAAMLNPAGQVRDILLTECGYASATNAVCTNTEADQAAALIYSYERVATNQYIDLILYNRETDDATEIAQGLTFGMTNQDGSHKLAYDYFKYMDTENATPYINAAKAVIGNWNMYAR